MLLVFLTRFTLGSLVKKPSNMILKNNFSRHKIAISKTSFQGAEFFKLVFW